MKIYFAWERQMTGRYQPVCFYGRKPENDVAFAVEVPADCMDMENEPNLGRLVKRFPLEVEE